VPGVGDRPSLLARPPAPKSSGGLAVVLLCVVAQPRSWNAAVAMPLNTPLLKVDLGSGRNTR
jgi:hypothetical protein